MYGNSMVWASLGAVVGLLLLMNTFLPKLYELKLYSIFTYIELRYDSPLITNITLAVGLGSALFHLMALSFLTALAFSTLINIPVWLNLVILNSIATIYTLCGGMKAVIWTDCLQCFVMLFSLSFIQCSAKCHEKLHFSTRKSRFFRSSGERVTVCSTLDTVV